MSRFQLQQETECLTAILSRHQRQQSASGSRTNRFGGASERGDEFGAFIISGAHVLAQQLSSTDNSSGKRLSVMLTGHTVLMRSYRPYEWKCSRSRTTTDAQFPAGGMLDCRCDLIGFGGS